MLVCDFFNELIVLWIVVFWVIFWWIIKIVLLILLVSNCELVIGKIGGVLMIIKFNLCVVEVKNLVILLLFNSLVGLGGFGLFVIINRLLMMGWIVLFILFIWLVNYEFNFLWFLRLNVLWIVGCCKLVLISKICIFFLVYLIVKFLFIVDLFFFSIVEVIIKVCSLWLVVVKLILVWIVLICLVMIDIGLLIVVRLIGVVVVIFCFLCLNI